MSEELTPNSMVFILGCQRSGTTWLANIFDSSPDTLLFMEPFSVPYGIFPDFPESSYIFESSSPFLDNYLQYEVVRLLLHYKPLISRRSLYDPYWFRTERFLARLILQYRRILPLFIVDRVRKFELLNLNRTDNSLPIYAKKISPDYWVIKELRLFGKITILRNTFPKAHFVSIIRHPCATVQSILVWFERGYLTELRSDLNTFFEKIEIQRTAHQYKSLVQKFRNGNLAHKVALYWRISNEVMYRQLDECPKANNLIYEQLALKPLETIESLFAGVGIELSKSTLDYVKYSSKSLNNKQGPITTIRDSANYYSSWVKTIDKSTHQSVLEVTEDSSLMSLFDAYYD